MELEQDILTWFIIYLLRVEATTMRDTCLLRPLRTSLGKSRLPNVLVPFSVFFKSFLPRSLTPRCLKHPGKVRPGAFPGQLLSTKAVSETASWGVSYPGNKIGFLKLSHFLGPLIAGRYDTTIARILERNLVGQID